MNEGDILSVTLTAGEWNTVLSHLAEGRYIVVAPLLQKIQGQCVGAAPEAGVPFPVPVPRTNGGAHAPD